MYGKKKLLLPALFLGVATLLLFSLKTLAQNNYDVTVSPIFFDLSTNPGTTVTDKIKIRNNTTAPIPIKINVNKLTGDVNGNLVLNSNKDDFTLSWVKFEETSVTLKPLEWTEIPFTVDVPEDASYGYYWTIALTQDNSSPLARSGVSLTGAAAVPVLLNVKKPGAKIDGKLTSFTTDKGFYDYLPVKFSTKFENTGNVHVRPHGNIFIKDWLGNQVAALEVNSAQGTVLPNAARIFENSWDDSFITVEPKLEGGQPKLDKNGKPETSLKIRWDKLLDLRIGRYTAETLLVISTDDKDIPFQATTSFFVFPWMLVIGLILVVIFAGIGFYSSLRNFIKRVLKIFRGDKNKKEEKHEEE